MTTTLTKKFLCLHTYQFDLATIFQLLLQKKMIRTMHNSLKGCINLRFLDLSRNDIVRIENVENMAFLEYIDLSHNKIQKVDALPPNLKVLFMRNNPVSRI